MMTGLPDPTTAIGEFPGRIELEALLRRLTSAEWETSVRSGDDARLSDLRTALDNPRVVAVLGAAGWVAPHFAVEYGGRGLLEDDARAALSLLAAWQVPHVPRGSGLALAAPTIRQWSSDDTKRRLLRPLVTGEERIVPDRVQYWVCTVEAMPVGIGAVVDPPPHAPTASRAPVSAIQTKRRMSISRLRCPPRPCGIR